MAKNTPNEIITENADVLVCLVHEHAKTINKMV